MAYVLALDEGTTSARAIVFDAEGVIRAIAQQEFRQHYPQPGWVEHDPNEIWTAQLQVARDALREAQLQPRELAAIGITNQRETTVLWERSSGQPIAPAIVWQDQRTAAFCDKLKADGHEPLIQERTGLVIDAYFSGSKLAWLLDHVPGARKQAEAGQLAFGTVDTWLIWNLTGGRVHVTDVSNASRTMLFNIHKGQWDDELLRLFRVPRSVLPEVKSSSEVYGQATVEGLSGVPVAGIAGDQQAALFGQMCNQPGLTKNTYGTGCFMLQNTGTKAIASKNRLVTTIAWKLFDVTEYALEGSVFIGGSVVKWLRDGLGIIKTSADVVPLAQTVPDNGGVYFVPAFVGLGAPHWDPYARGLLIGITGGTTAGHIARAAIEGIAFQVADVLEAMHADAGVRLSELRVDGGAARADLLLQFQANLLGVAVVRPVVTETTALGAAYLAGLATGVWQNTQEIETQRRVDHRFEPAMRPAKAKELHGRWKEALQCARQWEHGG